MTVVRSIEIWATVLWVRLALRFWPERELAYALRPDERASTARSTALAREFQHATRSIATGRCLLRAVACTRFLRRRGLHATLRVGFTESFHGHAWTDCDSDVYAARFRPFHCTAAGLAALIATRRTILSLPEELVES